MACTATLNGFGNSCETSKGGVKAIWIAPYKEGIATLVASASGEVGKVSIAQEDITKFKAFYIKQNQLQVLQYSESCKSRGHFLI